MKLFNLKDGFAGEGAPELVFCPDNKGVKTGL
jgi:hypothetical protein